MEQKQNKSIGFKLVILWLGILLLSSFWLSIRATSDPVSMAVLPDAPREEEPITATIKLNNPSSEPIVIRYQFYVNGEFLREGATNILPGSDKIYQFTYENPLTMGEQLNFVVKTESELGSYEKVHSSPPYPPQIWTSFVSFGSFSTWLISSMNSTAYYQSTFGSEVEFNLGIITIVVLIALLIFLELTQPPIRGKIVAFLSRLRIRLSTVTWLLLIIFMGMVYTKMVMILTT